MFYGIFQSGKITIKMYFQYIVLKHFTNTIILLKYYLSYLNFSIKNII